MILAIDIGGTKTLVAIADKNGKKISDVRFETPQVYSEFLVVLQKTIAELTTDTIDVVSVAIPALLDRTNGVAIAFGNLDWHDVPFQKDIQKIAGALVIYDNDAKLAALSEANAISPLPHRALYITISTGIGGGYVVDGKLDPNLQDMEVGQMTLEFEGKFTTWEHIASGKAISNKFNKRVGDMHEPAELFYLGHTIALGLNNLIATLTPDVIIFGGGAGSHLENFRDQLETQLQILCNDMVVIPPIVTAKDGENAVVNGCILQALRHAAN